MGAEILAGIGVDVDRTGARPQLRDCLDWTERRPHLAGRLPAEICRVGLERDWIRRIGTSRAVRVTGTGVAAFEDYLGTAIAAEARI